MRPLLYVCAPWRKRTEESMKLTHLTIDRALEKGWTPIFAPFLFGSRFDDKVPEERELALDLDLSILARCDGLVVVCQPVTEGMRRELDAWAPRPVFEGRYEIQEPSVPGARQKDEAQGPREDWTVGENGRTNTSHEFNHLGDVLTALLKNSACDLIDGRARSVAGLIVGQLAHRFRFDLPPKPSNHAVRCPVCIVHGEEAGARIEKGDGA